MKIYRVLRSCVYSLQPLEKKFVRVSGEATIGHVEKFLRRKMDLDPACQVQHLQGHLLVHYDLMPVPLLFVNAEVGGTLPINLQCV